MHPTTLANADDDALCETASRLVEHYSKYITIAKHTTVRDLAKMIIVDYNSVTATFGEVVTAMLLFMTACNGSQGRAPLFQTENNSIIPEEQHGTGETEWVGHSVH